MLQADQNAYHVSYMTQQLKTTPLKGYDVRIKCAKIRQYAIIDRVVFIVVVLYCPSIQYCTVEMRSAILA